MALAKSLPLTESTSLLFRVEAFNVFNHAQFNGPNAIDGNIGSSTFGERNQRGSSAHPSRRGEAQLLIAQFRAQGRGIYSRCLAAFAASEARVNC